MPRRAARIPKRGLRLNPVQACARNHCAGGGLAKDAVANVPLQLFTPLSRLLFRSGTSETLKWQLSQVSLERVVESEAPVIAPEQIFPSTTSAICSRTTAIGQAAAAPSSRTNSRRFS